MPQNPYKPPVVSPSGQAQGVEVAKKARRQRARPPANLPTPSTGVRKQETVERHREILAEALELIGEVGYHGASLRELARRLGISQPSLYHYFSSKEELAEQIIEAYASDMIRGGGELLAKVHDAEGLLALPKQVREFIFMLWGPHSDHPKFSRFVFAVARLDPRFAKRNRELFVDRVRAVAEPALAPLVAATGIEMERLVFPLVALVNAIGFALMEEKVLFDEQPIRDDVYRLADEAVAMTELWLRHLLDEARERGVSVSTGE
jgi:AcrR family transcriptional regulator